MAIRALVNDSSITGCSIQGPVDNGIVVRGNNNVVDDNKVDVNSGGTGISVEGNGVQVTRNRVRFYQKIERLPDDVKRQMKAAFTTGNPDKKGLVQKWLPIIGMELPEAIKNWEEAFDFIKSFFV